jgi:tryptophan halogenase
MGAAPVRDVVIVGGGTAGWMTAAAFSKVMGNACRIRLVESDEIATIGVGEATIPTIKAFNGLLELDEDEFLRRTQGTFKLGIEFVNWGQVGEAYIHGFGTIGASLENISCHHYWLKMRRLGQAAELDRYSINTAACRQARYMRSVPDMPNSPLGEIANAFHFDAGLYAQYLRGLSEARGVVRTEGRIVQTVLREADGFIESLVLASGEKITGDFFIDCSGTRALLIGDAMGVPYDDWSRWLPCDRAIAVPCESVSPLLPYTRATAHSAGWQWRIPLQSRIGNGHVYSSQFMNQDEATSILLNHLDGKQLAEPRYIPFVPGRRKKTWVKNCVAVGLSSGFFEPIESTNIHLIQSAIGRVISLFPNSDFHQADIDEYNGQIQFEYERVRDFIILHYKATQRTDSPFWNHCRNMAIPDSLQHRMDLYASNGRAYREAAELFAEGSWVQVMNGQGLRPQGYHPHVDLLPQAEIKEFLGNIESVIQKCVDVMPTHEEYIAQHCAVSR